jgi:HK97 family phage portal protein
MLRRLFTQNEQTEERGVTYQSLFLTDGLLVPRNLAGVEMNQATAMKIGVVYAAVRLIADSIATLPMDTFVRRIPSGGGPSQRVPYRPRPEWVMKPDADPSVARSDFWQSIIFSQLIAGNAYCRILRDNDGMVLGFKALDPLKVEPRLDSRGFVEYVFNHSQVIAGEDVVHITDLRKPGMIKGISRVDELRDVLGISRALDEFAARYFGNGTITSGIISYPGDMTAEQASRLKNEFEKNSRGLRNAHRPNILTGGAKYEKMSADAAESQLIQAREFSVLEVCRAFKIQPAMLGVVQPGAMSYASVEQQHLQFVTLTLRPIVTQLEEQFSKLLPGEAFLRFNMEGLLRGDLQSRYAAYSQGIQAGFLSINDIHRLEDLRDVDGGDVYRVPLSHVDLSAANIVEQDKRISMAVRLINVGFDPAEVLQSLDLPSIDHTGLPSVQLQNAAQHTEAAVEEVYPGDRAVETEQEQRNVAEDIANAIGATLRDLPQPVVNVTVPEQPARTRHVRRDSDGNITEIVEE